MSEPQEIIIPSSEADRATIRRKIEEISGCWHRAAGERDTIKDIINDLAEEFGIPKDALRLWAKNYHNSTFDKTTADAEAAESARILIFKDGGSPTRSNDDENVEEVPF